MNDRHGSVIVVRDDISEAGLRRLRLVSGEPVDVMFYLRRALEEGEVELYLEWKDEETGLYHMYLVWRLEMCNPKMWVKAIGNDDLRAAVGKTAQGYQRRFGRWPNWAMVRKNGQAQPEGVRLMKSETEEIGVVRIVEVERNFPVGFVGVYYQEVEPDEKSPG